MRFEAMLPALKDGMKVGRSGSTKMLQCGHSTFASAESLIADDWEIIEEHKLCPGCGNNGELHGRRAGEGRDEYMIECKSFTACFSTTPWVATEEAAWDAWDRRV